MIKKCVVNNDIVFNEIEMDYKLEVSEHKPKGRCDGEKANIEVESNRRDLSKLIDGLVCLMIIND